MSSAFAVAADIIDPPELEDLRRDSQKPPEGDWRVWLLHPGRRWGKGFAASRWIDDRVRKGTAQSIALVGSTNSHVRQLMIEHPESGLLAVSAGAVYLPGRAEVHWPNGAKAYICSAENADKPPLRGGGFDTSWADEVDSWGLDTTNRKASDAWENLNLSMSSGDSRMVVTSTPKPGRIVSGLLERAKKDEDVEITTGSTYENAANLSPEFIAAIERRYKGTRLERQEIYGEVLAEIYGALWTPESFKYRPVELDQLSRVLVGNDPSGGGDMIGIVAVGQLAGMENSYIVLDDWTLHGSPATWARRTIELTEKWQADHIAAERNFGGAMVESTIRSADRNAPVRLVNASLGKGIRAEPISLIYEQGFDPEGKPTLDSGVWHREGAGLDLLEYELMHITSKGYIGEGSPNRLDAMVWAATGLSKQRKTWGIV